MEIRERIHFFAGNTSGEENGQEGKIQKNGRVFAGNLKQVENPIEKKRKEAQKEALKIIGDAFAGEQKLDEDIQNRKQRISEAQEVLSTTTEKLDEVDANKQALKDTYQIEDDSQEQKDLELLEKRREAMKPGGEKLTEEDLERLKVIDEQGLTEYQVRALELDDQKDRYMDDYDEAMGTLIEENAIIRGIKLERLKKDPVLEAANQAEEVLEAANKEIIGMLIDEAKDAIDNKFEEEMEKAEEKKEKEEELEERIEKNAEEKAKQEEEMDIPMDRMVELDQIQKDVQKEVEDMIDKMKLVAEDIKGSVVDQLL